MSEVNSLPAPHTIKGLINKTTDADIVYSIDVRENP